LSFVFNMSSNNLPRRYYKIGDVGKILGVEPYVLRFWESQFPQIKTVRTKGGQRLYPRESIEVLKKIKRLLYEEGLTIDGAKKRLKQSEWIDSLVTELKSELIEIKNLLSS